PAGAFRRIAKAPALPGSPYSTAAWAPAGNIGGAGPHWVALARTAAWACSDMACGASAAIARPDASRQTESRILVMRRLPGPTVEPVSATTRGARAGGRSSREAPSPAQRGRVGVG